jgi:microcystin-dependent protein
MSITFTPLTVSSSFDASTINQNFATIATLLQQALSRSGTAPNQMNSTFDMNGYAIINQANSVVLETFNWRQDWETATSYDAGDAVFYNSTAYLCNIAHTSSAEFITDLLAFRWSNIDLGTKFQGAWAPNTGYFIGDIVLESNQLYYCIADHISGVSISLTNFIEYGAFGSMATQDSNSVNITGGTISVSSLTATTATINGGTIVNTNLNLPTGACIALLGPVSAIPSGWIRVTNGTIGSAASGATIRANIDTQALYVQLWNEFPSLDVSGGRGVDGLQDFLANKTIALDDFASRVFAAFGQNPNVTGASNFSLGDTYGEQDHLLTVDELAAHAHTDSGHSHSIAGATTVGATVANENGNNTTRGVINSTGSATANIQPTGGNQPHNTYQPTMFVTMMCKL